MTFYELNGIGDLAMDGDIRRYIGTLVELVKVTKAGPYQVRAFDGKMFSVAKYNLTDTHRLPDRDNWRI